MRLIHPTYRAVFQQPFQGPLNPMGLKIGCRVPAEVYSAIGRPNHWLARSGPKTEPWPIPDAPSANEMKLAVQAHFEKQLEPWQMWGDGNAVRPPRILQPDEVEVRENGQVYLKEPEKPR